MDQRLETVLQDVDHINTINNQKRLLKEQYVEDCVFYYNGGKFTVTKELLGFTTQLGTSYITDDNLVPVEIDKDEFNRLISNVYWNATKKYHTAYQELIKNSRNIEELLNL